MQTTYSFLDVACSLVGPGGFAALGNGSGVAEEGITFTPSGDKNTMTMGADGSGMHSLHADKSGTITVRLLKNSPMNAVLGQMYNFQTASGSTHGQNTIVTTNKAMQDVLTATQVAFKKIPDLTFAKEGQIVEWQFDAIKVDFLLGAP